MSRRVGSVSLTAGQCPGVTRIWQGSGTVLGTHLAVREAVSYLPDCRLGETQKDGLLVYLESLPCLPSLQQLQLLCLPPLWYQGASARDGPEQSLGLTEPKRCGRHPLLDQQGLEKQTLV